MTTADLLSRYYQATIRLLWYCQADLEVDTDSDSGESVEPDPDQNYSRFLVYAKTFNEAVRYLLETDGLTNAPTTDSHVNSATIYDNYFTLLFHPAGATGLRLKQLDLTLRHYEFNSADLASYLSVLADLEDLNYDVVSYYYDLTPESITRRFLQLVDKAEDILTSSDPDATTAARVGLLGSDLEAAAYDKVGTGVASHSNLTVALAQLGQYRALAPSVTDSTSWSPLPPTRINSKDITTAQWLLGREFDSAKALLLQSSNYNLRLYEYDATSFSAGETVPEKLNTDDR